MQSDRRRRRTGANWEEHDAYTNWRRMLFWQRGETKGVKRRTHRRERREAKAEINGTA